VQLVVFNVKPGGTNSNKELPRLIRILLIFTTGGEAGMPGEAL